MSSLQKSILKSKLPPSGLDFGMPSRACKSRAYQRKRDYDPVEWRPYFDESKDVKIEENTFHIYTKGDEGPVLVLLHGGGFSALTWAEFTNCNIVLTTLSYTMRICGNTKSGVIHGGDAASFNTGMASMISAAPSGSPNPHCIGIIDTEVHLENVSKSIMTMVVCKVMAIDLRGHGDSHTTNDEDLSADMLARDVAAVIEKVDDSSPIVLVGHSMGGAVAVRAAPLIPNIAGVAVIDVVEGTAMDALTSMQSFLRSRPSSFSTIPQAIEWCIRSGQIRNIDSAKISVPGQIKNIKTGKLATHDIESHLASVEHVEHLEPLPLPDDTIQEEEPVAMLPPNQTTCSTSVTSSNKKYTWRIDLGKTEQHWSGWFQGLSAAFLNVAAPKMLLLAGVDRLDRELTVGQMQGKFQMQVLPACGHAVHEDVPDKVAEAIATFMVRHKFAEPASDFPRTLPAC